MSCKSSTDSVVRECNLQILIEFLLVNGFDFPKLHSNLLWLWLEYTDC